MPDARGFLGKLLANAPVGLIFLGLAISGVLWSHQLAGVLPDCSGGGCAVVHTSPLAAASPVPLPLLGLAGYGSALAFFLLRGRASAPWAGGAYRCAVIALALAGAALTAYSGLVLRSFCPWCVLSAASSCAIAALHFGEQREAPTASPRAIAVAAAFAACMVAWFGPWNRAPSLDLRQAEKVDWSATVRDTTCGQPGRAGERLLAFIDPGCGMSRLVAGELIRWAEQRPGRAVSFIFLPNKRNPVSIDLAAYALAAGKRGHLARFLSLAASGDPQTSDEARSLYEASAAGSAPPSEAELAGHRARLANNAELARAVRLSRKPAVLAMSSGNLPEEVTLAIS